MNSLTISNFNDKYLSNKMEHSLQSGQTLLIENINTDQALDPMIDPIILKLFYKKAGLNYLYFNDHEIIWHDHFQLFLATKLSNPHYLPEIQIKILMINCTVTKLGLENQLLSYVVAKEVPEVEIKRDRLIINMANDAKQLDDLEKRILNLLNQSQGNILDDDQLIQTLAEAKDTSNIISIRVKEQIETNKQISNTREKYNICAKLGAELYFAVSAMSNIDNMYQYSLDYFIRLFNIAIDTAAPVASSATAKKEKKKKQMMFQQLLMMFLMMQLLMQLLMKQMMFQQLLVKQMMFQQLLMKQMMLNSC